MDLSARLYLRLDRQRFKHSRSDTAWNAIADQHHFNRTGHSGFARDDRLHTIRDPFLPVSAIEEGHLHLWMDHFRPVSFEFRAGNEWTNTIGNVRFDLRKSCYSCFGIWLPLTRGWKRKEGSFSITLVSRSLYYSRTKLEWLLITEAGVTWVMHRLVELKFNLDDTRSNAIRNVIVTDDL